MYIKKARRSGQEAGHMSNELIRCVILVNNLILPYATSYLSEMSGIWCDIRL
jgi:hypothetical protein